jgi:1-acyl-sn-glycerol-3-phosphate acyltransferase
MDSAIVAAREALIAAATRFLGQWSDDELRALRQRVADLMSEATPEELERVAERLRTTGSDWTYYPPDPFSRRVHYALADVALTPDSTLEGAEHLEASQHAPLVFVPNHVSYADANLVEIMLHRFGFDELAGRLCVIAGPKVYAELFRRFSSLCFGTIKTPQSSARSSGEAVMAPRDVAREARRSIGAAHERQRLGDHLLVFIEGTRSRQTRLQPALAAVTRYFDFPGSKLVPLAVTGGEKLVPVGDERLNPARITVRIGPSFEAARLAELARGKRQLMVDAIALRIAQLLPPSYRGAYADDVEGLEAARQIADAL